MSSRIRVLVTGAAGFLGHHLVRALVKRGCWVRGVDLSNPLFEGSPATEFLKLDLTLWEDCLTAMEGIDFVFALAANTVRPTKAGAARDNTLINVHCLEAAREQHVRRFLYTSSSLVYPSGAPQPFTEHDASGGDAGWDDLSMERICRKYRKDYNLETRIARVHNVYGPQCSYDAHSATSPIGICRRIAAGLPGDLFEIPGDGRQSFSYLYVDDCVDGLMLTMRSAYAGPMNIATTSQVSLNELVDLTTRIAGKPVRKEYIRSQTSSGRMLNTDLARQKLQWQPGVSLEDGLRRTYRWIEQELGYEDRLPRARSAVA